MERYKAKLYNPPPPFSFGSHICHNCLPRFFFVAICLLLFAVAPRRQPVPPATISSPASALAPPPVIFWWLNIPATNCGKLLTNLTNQSINYRYPAIRILPSLHNSFLFYFHLSGIINYSSHCLVQHQRSAYLIMQVRVRNRNPDPGSKNKYSYMYPVE